MTEDPLIVCVDDDAALLAVLVRGLRTLGVRVLSTSDPQRALSWVHTHDVAVLVSDYEMPGLNGVELAVAARRARPDTVRVLMTGHTRIEPAVEGINRGEVFRYLQKPFERERFEACVRSAIARHQELVKSSDERKRGERFAKLRAELELEFPGITSIEHAPDGAYVVPTPDPATVRGAGLDALLALRLR